MQLSQKLKEKIKKNLTIALVICALISSTLATFKLADFSMNSDNTMYTTTLAETGDEADSYTTTRLENTDTITYIYDAADLVAFRNAVNAGNSYAGKTVYLMDDIDLSTVCSSTLGSWSPISTFSGTFNGNYHVISNLYINTSSSMWSGLFSSVSTTGTVQNLIMQNAIVYSTYYIGGAGASGTAAIVGNNSGKVINCGVSGKVDARQTTSVSGDRIVIIGGIVGNNNGTIQNCYNKAAISGLTHTSNNVNNTRAGGIAGACSAGQVTNCYNTGTITITGARFYVGGIVGCFHGTNHVIRNCYNSATVTINGSSSAKKKAGGIVGVNGDTSAYRGTISNSYCLTSSYTYSYYYNGSSTTTSGKIAAATLQTYTVQLGNAYAYDIYNINSGYPVLAWQNKRTVMKLNKNQEYIKVGEHLDLNVIEDNEIIEIIGHIYDDTDFKWTSTNEDVAIVDENGTVTGISDGYTTIYAHNETSGLYAMCVVNVAKEFTNPQIETGNGFTVILKADGTVWTIGNNASGQLGNGTTESSKVPVNVHIDEDTILNNILKISVGTDHVLALAKDGKVYSWGLNTNGQLGINNTESSNYAKIVLGEDGASYLNGIVDISSRCLWLISSR